jgi:two-component sensor histidine kinase
MLIGPPIELSADLAVPIGMALHELTTNAVRHGALSVPDGYVEVRWDIIADDGGRRLQLEWKERGGPPASPPTQEGFGSTLLRRVLPMQVNADVQIDFDAEGLRFRLQAPFVDRRLVPAY